jgi:hypothetical protein
MVRLIDTSMDSPDLAPATLGMVDFSLASSNHASMVNEWSLGKVGFWGFSVDDAHRVAFLYMRPSLLVH